jgi:predicted transcriptional regulator
MKASDVMTAPAVCCSAHDTLEYVAELMWDYEIHTVAVVDGSGRPVGWVTDRAICMTALRARQSLGALRVEQAMLRAVPTVKSDLGLSLLKARKASAPWLLVLDDSGAAAGVVTDGDIERARRRAQPLRPADEMLADRCLAPRTLRMLGLGGAAGAGRRVERKSLSPAGL